MVDAKILCILLKDRARVPLDHIYLVLVILSKHIRFLIDCLPKRARSEELPALLQFGNFNLGLSQEA